MAPPLASFSSPISASRLRSSCAKPSIRFSPPFASAYDGCLDEQTLPTTGGSQLTGDNGVLIGIFGRRGMVLRETLLAQGSRNRARDQIFVGSDPALS